MKNYSIKFPWSEKDTWNKFEILQKDQSNNINKKSDYLTFGIYFYGDVFLNFELFVYVVVNNFSQQRALRFNKDRA